MATAQPTTSCRTLHKQLKDSTCSMPIHTFIINNKENFKKKIHLYIKIREGLSTIFIHQMPNYFLFIIKSTFYIGIKIFNSLPGNWTILQNVKAEFKIAVRKYCFVTHLWIHGMRVHICVCVCVCQKNIQLSVKDITNSGHRKTS